MFSGSIRNELSVIKPLIKNTQLKTVFDLLNELKPMKLAFHTTIQLIQGAVTIPVSSVSCERKFSKMKLIETRCRNSMGDERLSDISVLAIEKQYQMDLRK
jgi:hAT family protein